MLKTSTRSFLLLSTALLACNGDGGDPKADACDQIVACACSTPRYTSVDACLADIDLRLAEDKKVAADNMLVFDEGCYDKSLRYLVDLECRTQSQVDSIADLLCPFCAPVHGDKPVGAACTVYGDGYSDCASDLVCYGMNNDRACVSPCVELTAGQPCGDGVNFLGCVDGLYCSFESGRCEPLLADAASCMAGFECMSGYCDATQACGQAPGMGEACDFACAEGLVCDMNTCATPPPAGQPCVFGACAEGSQCNASEICELEEALACEVDFHDDAEPGPP